MDTIDPARRPAIRAVPFDEVGKSIGRLLVVAQSDTGQSAKVADFLLAWWNGDDLGHFPILHLCNVDASLAEDMLIIMAYLSQNGVWYANKWEFDAAMRELAMTCPLGDPEED